MFVRQDDFNLLVKILNGLVTFIIVLAVAVLVIILVNAAVYPITDYGLP